MKKYHYTITKLTLSAILSSAMFTSAVFAEQIPDTDYTISATTEGTVKIDVYPSPTDAASTGSQNIRVNTTCPHGYDVYVSTDNDDGNFYRNANRLNKDYISSTTTTSGALGDNEWGISMDNGTTFSQVPAMGNPLKIISVNNSVTTTKLTYGMKASASLRTGRYGGTVVYTIIPNQRCTETLDKEFKDAYQNANKLQKSVNGKQYYIMQDMNEEICSAVTTPSKEDVEVPEIKLVDTRDDNIYLIRKLADGNCWMTQDLKLMGYRDLTSSDTDIVTKMTLPDSSSFSSSGLYVEAGELDTQYGNKTYYSWTAATGNSKGSNLGDAGRSICPANWQLPRSTGSKSYDGLIKAYGATQRSPFLSDPVKFPYPAFHSEASSYGSYEQAYYWTSSAADANNAYALSMTRDFIGSEARPKQRGYPVRCVARDTPPEDTGTLATTAANNGVEIKKANDGKNHYVMQSFDSSICDQMGSISATYTFTMVDARDGEVYDIIRTKKGVCWMAQNLRFKLSSDKTLTPLDTDVVADWTPQHNTQTEAGTIWESEVNAATVNQSRSFIDASNSVNGGYYNWYAATAGSGLYDRPFIDGQEVESSICPRGWTLAEAGGALDSVYSAVPDEVTIPPLALTYSGTYSPASGKIVNAGNYGSWWTAIAKDTNKVKISRLDKEKFSTTYTTTDLNAGRSVRCSSAYKPYNLTFKDGSRSISLVVNSKKKLDVAYYSRMFSKDGYYIKEWVDSKGRSYDPLHPFLDVNPDNLSNQTLTIVWAQHQTDSTFFNIQKMQQMTAEICSSATTPSVSAALMDTDGSHSGDPEYVPTITLADTRDGNTYTVRKLADGNCWMTQGLRLATAYSFTSADTDTFTNFIIRNNTFSSTYTDSRFVSANSDEYADGAYYNWFAANGGRNEAGDTATVSICPKGWRLPDSHTNYKSYKKLINTYNISNDEAGSSKIQSFPLDFKLGGVVKTRSVVLSGTEGYYWTSSIYSTTYTFAPLITATGVSSVAAPKSWGVMVRCIAR